MKWCILGLENLINFIKNLKIFYFDKYKVKWNMWKVRLKKGIEGWLEVGGGKGKRTKKEIRCIIWVNQLPTISISIILYIHMYNTIKKKHLKLLSHDSMVIKYRLILKVNCCWGYSSVAKALLWKTWNCKFDSWYQKNKKFFFFF